MTASVRPLRLSALDTGPRGCPGPCAAVIVDDTTRIVGEALHRLNVEKLADLINSLCHYAGTLPRPRQSCRL